MKAPSIASISPTYDKAYFDKWYRSPRHRVKTAVELARQVAFVLHAAEWVIGRRVRTVLDVGCGEGNWRAPLKRLRPRLEYTGVDPSEYAIARFGKRRNLRLGMLENLGALNLEPRYDLIVCCGMLNYVSAASLSIGLTEIACRTYGMAFLEIFTRRDHAIGDTSWIRPKPARWYRQRLTNAGFTSVGLHCYVAGDRQPIAELERGL